MNQKEILERIHQSEDNRIKIAITDIDGVLRGKIIRKEKLLSTLEQGAGFCDVVFGWDMMDAAYDNAEVTGWHTGYPDATFHLDPETFRNIPWDEQIPFFLGDFSVTNHPACPRSLL